jgi:hypothetical protein
MEYKDLKKITDFASFVNHEARKQGLDHNEFIFAIAIINQSISFSGIMSYLVRHKLISEKEV